MAENLYEWLKKLEKEYPQAKDARLRYEQACLNKGWDPYENFLDVKEALVEPVEEP